MIFGIFILILSFILSTSSGNPMKKPTIVEKMATDRMRRLLGMAEERAKEGTAASITLEKRYVAIARRISMHYKVRVPDGLKHRICKKCGSFLVPGVNCKVRLSSSHGYLAYLCECGAETHSFYKQARTRPPMAQRA